MKLDFDPVGVMLVRGIEEDMTARHEEQPTATFEEEAAGTCEQTVAVERCDARGREQERFGHRGLQGCTIVPIFRCHAPASETASHGRRHGSGWTCAFCEPTVRWTGLR